MEHRLRFYFIITLFAGLILAFTNCTKEGPVGPEGPAGSNGTNGTNGTDGTAGVDGNQTCLVCHTQAGMDIIDASYALSGHNAAGAVGYAGGRASCARCHSSEGFENYLANTPGVDPVDIAYPTAISCATCHATHSSLEDGISAPMATVAAVIGISDGTEFDFGNSSNLCINCHQSRRDYTYYEALDSVKIDNVQTVVPDGYTGINSSHAGPHHGPQANTLNGNGGYGSSSTGAHTELGCITCHMGEVNTTGGGHSFGSTVASCVTCHEGATNMDINGKQTEFDTRMEAIAQALVEVGALSFDEESGEYHPHVTIVTDAEFKAFWNYMMLYEDHSHGVHNPVYFATLLAGAEANLGL